jgi:hypothetical protein
VTLENKKLSAGEKFDLKIETVDGFEIDPLSGVSVYLGLIVSNVFLPGHELMRPTQLISKNNYQVYDLNINPWVHSYQKTYTVEHLTVYEKDTFKQHVLRNLRGDSYYYDDDGQRTDIAVIQFSVLPNPNSDITPPVMTSFTVSKSEIFADEYFDVSFSAYDLNSGVSNNAIAAVIIPNQSLMNANLSWDGESNFTLHNLKIEHPDWIEEESFPLQFMFNDKGGNYGFLLATNPKDKFYVDQAGNLTNIPVIHLKIKK